MWVNLRLGAVDYVCVPIIPEILRAKVAVFVDLHRKTRELQALNRELEERVAQRTADLAKTLAALESDAARLEQEIAERKRLEQELRQQADRLSDVDRRKDEFLAMLAHELRNPLAPIRSGLDLLVLEGQCGATVDLMKQQVEHLVRLVDDLLDVSRIMQGRIHLRKEPLDVSAVIHRAVEMSRSLIDGHSQQFHLSLPSDTGPVWVEGDAVRLTQVVTNLLNNAVKYTDQGGQIWLAVERAEGMVRISVRDDGIGIDPAFLPRIFELFSQASRSLDRSQGGLGIGLTLARNLVEMHGGTVTAHSDGLGTGAEFVLSLPEMSPERVAALPPKAPSLEAPGRRILVVDDATDAAKVLALLLTKLGEHEVEVASDGPTALRQAEDFQPEIVFLDIGLPGMSGYEVAQRLRQEHGLKETLIVALTGYGQEEDRRHSREAGCDEHLVKPPALEELQAMLVHPKLQGASRPGEVVPPASFPRSGQHRLQLPAARQCTRGAKASDRGMGKFLRQLAHEVGNAVMPVRLFLQTFRCTEADPARLDRAQRMLNDHFPTVTALMESLRRLESIVHDVELDFQSLELEPLVTGAVDRARPLALERRQSLEVRLAEPALQWRGDQALLEEALFQVVENAVRYTPPEGQIIVTAQREGDQVVLSVRDTGRGISPDVLPHVFDMFVREESEVDFPTGHMGVGLALVRQIVEAHHGTVQAQSAGAGRGSTFTIRLPLDAPQDDSDQQDEKHNDGLLVSRAVKNSRRAGSSARCRPPA
jgi:signal transduction histidine kinase